LPVKSIKSYNDFQSIIDSTIKNKNLFYAVKVTGKFSYIKTRTVPPQEKPYKPLTEVTKTQPVFEKKDQNGTLVGFMLPAFTAGVNVPGYHLHFLSSDKTFGGHVLEFSFDEATVEIQEINNFYMTLPEDDSAFGNIDLSKDRTKELHEVEK
jgi:acetolactate decarboxylase